MQRHDGLYPRQEAKDEVELQLATWLHKQRREYATGHMQLERKVALESLPAFQWRPQADQWEAHFARLEAS